MAKVTFATDIQSISGKLCKNEGVIYSVNKQTGRAYRSDRHKFTDKNSAEQQSVRTVFKTRSQAQKEWWNNNKPLIAKDGTVTREATADYQHLLKLYKAQNKIGNPYSFLRTFVQDDGTVTIGTKRTATTSGTGSTPTTPTDRTEIDG